MRPGSSLAPVDRVHVLFYAFVTAVAALRASALPHAALSIAWYGGALAATLVLAQAVRGRGEKAATRARVAFAFVAAPVSFLMLGGVVPCANPFHAERVLYEIDTAMFLGKNPNVLLDSIAWPPLTELLQVDYSLYYAIPLVLFVCLVLQDREAAAPRSLFLVILCLYASYVGYFLVPATGPNLNVAGLYPAHFAQPMEGLWAAEGIRARLLEAEAIKHDCWPSGHAALAVVCLAIAARESRLAFRILAVPVALLVASTVYLRYHYVIDVLCGLLLAWAVMRFGPRLYEAWSGRKASEEPAALVPAGPPARG